MLAGIETSPAAVRERGITLAVQWEAAKSVCIVEERHKPCGYSVSGLARHIRPWINETSVGTTRSDDEIPIGIQGEHCDAGGAVLRGNVDLNSIRGAGCKVRVSAVIR